jgi:hypothetical protein
MVLRGAARCLPRERRFRRGGGTAVAECSRVGFGGAKESVWAAWTATVARGRAARWWCSTGTRRRTGRGRTGGAQAREVRGDGLYRRRSCSTKMTNMPAVVRRTGGEDRGRTGGSTRRSSGRSGAARNLAREAGGLQGASGARKDGNGR